MLTHPVVWSFVKRDISFNNLQILRIQHNSTHELPLFVDKKKGLEISRPLKLSLFKW